MDCYSDLKDAASLLELALWTSKIAQRRIVMKAEARDNCGATVIIPNVLSFLVPSLSVEDIAFYEQMNSDESDSFMSDSMENDSYFSHSDDEYYGEDMDYWGDYGEEEEDDGDDDYDDSEDETSMEE